MNKTERLCKPIVGAPSYGNTRKTDTTVPESHNNKAGITLVALVITIIILLILAGITINLTIGQRGILTRAQEAGRNYQEAAKREDEELANFLKEADDIINGITGNGGGTTPTTPEISEAVKGLKVGDYIKYDTGVTTVGENGVITCRVLYPVDSEYGLQIISDKNVGTDITLGGSDWETGKTAYNGAIETLNNEAQKYVNEAYAYDGRCVGSIPTVQNGMFVNKNKVRDGEGNIQNTVGTVALPPSTWTSYTRPTGWTSDDTGCYNTDTNYTIDETTLKGANIWKTGQHYWLASRNVASVSSGVIFYVRYVGTGGDLLRDDMCLTLSGGGTLGYSRAHGLRPCISLKSNIIKITGGDGTSEGTAYTIGK